MRKIDLFSAIDYQKKTSFLEKTLSVLSNYFYLGGVRVTVLSNNQLHLQKEKIKWSVVALKVSSYILLFPLTLSLLAVHVCLRSRKKLIVTDDSLGSKLPRPATHHTEPQNDLKTPLQQTVLKQSCKTSPACPSEYEPYLALAPKNFIKKILSSSLYSSEEKNNLFLTCKFVYDNLGKPTTPNAWVLSPITYDYLTLLSIKHPNFRILNLEKYQIKDEKFNKTTIDSILAQLPKDIDKTPTPKTPTLFGYPIQVHGNHRTSFIIDLKNKTVEYYNSFGSDETVKSVLSELARSLSHQYNQPFIYRHVTAAAHLQTDAYQCGIWSCKFIEERIQQGANFQPISCKNQNMAEYRVKVFEKVLKHKFYCTIGEERLNKLQRQSPDFSVEKSTDFELKKNEYKKKYFYNIDVEYYNWCKTGVMAATLQEAINEIEKETITWRSLQPKQ